MKAKIDKSGIIILLSLIFSFFIVLPSCTETIGAKSGKKDIFSMDNLVAWCVVPFDAMNREPEERAQETASRVALYNHMGWSGEPENQVRIIEKFGRDDVGIVYNFHHAHHRVDDFKRLLDIMMPYLYTVNLNGMRIDGPKIMDIGSGNLEASMIKSLLESGFEGTVGILDHVGDEDAEDVLRRNLEGLEKILNEI